MAASYPGAIKTFTDQIDGADWVLAGDINDAYAEIEAIETELGIDVAGSLADLVTRLAVVLDDDGTLKLSGITEHTGIANNNIVEVDGAPNTDEISLWTADGLDGKTHAELIALWRTAGLIGIGDDDLLEVDSASAASGELARFTAAGLESRSNAEIKAQLAYLTDLSDDTTPTFGGDMDASDKDLHNLKQVDYQDTHANGDSGAAKTIDWNECNIQSVRLTANCTFTFTAPAGPCGLTLYLLGDGTARTTAFPATAKFVDDAEPAAWGTTNNEVVGIISIRYDTAMTANYIMSGGAIT